MKLTPTNPISSMAHVDGSGTADAILGPSIVTLSAPVLSSNWSSLNPNCNCVAPTGDDHSRRFADKKRCADDLSKTIGKCTNKRLKVNWICRWIHIEGWESSCPSCPYRCLHQIRPKASFSHRCQRSCPRPRPCCWRRRRAGHAGGPFLQRRAAAKLGWIVVAGSVVEVRRRPGRSVGPTVNNVALARTNGNTMSRFTVMHRRVGRSAHGDQEA